MKHGDELEIEIAADGQVRVVTHGVKGRRCLDYLEIFRELLGPVSSKQTTPEFNEIETGAQTQIEAHVHARRIEF